MSGPRTTRYGQIVIENPHRGWARSLDSSPAASVRKMAGGTGSNQYARSYNGGPSLMRAGYEGHMAGAFVFDSLTDAGARVNSAPVNMAVTRGSNTQVWVVLQSGRLVAFDLGDDVVDTTRTAISPASGTVTTSRNHDIMTHKISSGNERVFVSYEYNSSAAADIGIFDNAGGNIDDDFFSTRAGGAVLTGGVPLKLWIGPDSNVCCTNGRYVAVYDTLTDGANALALDLGLNWIASAGARFGNYNVIAAYQGASAATAGDNSLFALGSVRVFFWNGYDPRYNYQYDIPDNISGEVEVVGDELRVYTTGRGGTTKIWKFNGNGFGVSPAEEIGGTSLIVPIHGSVARFRNHTVFPSYNNNASEFILVAYGANDPSVESPGVHSFAYGNQDFGVVKEIRSNVLYSSGNTAIYKLNEAKYGAGFFYSLNYPLPPGAIITDTKFHFSKFDTGCTVVVSGFKNGDSTKDFYNGETISKANLNTDFYQVINKEIQNCNSFELAYTLTVSNDLSPIIRRIEINYKYEVLTQ